MPFNSMPFFVGLSVVAAVLFALPHRWRWAWLLAASYGYYMTWQPVAAIALVAVTALVYEMARAIAGATSPRMRRGVLAMAVVSAAAPLMVLKYAGFLNEGLSQVASLVGLTYHVAPVHLLLPVGISFFTFKALAYVIDVYRGAPPERHAGRLALYIAFFPQILAGPIERPTRFLSQLETAGRWDVQRIIAGMKRALWGLFTKVVIADNLAVLVNRVYDSPADQTGVSLLIATYLFAFQILCDFSGYTDMAIGVAKILGFTTMENFKRPYFATSIADFWRRWHISLSSWFRDYLYIPLGGSRVTPVRWALNILVVFLVSGLWHGANWTFVVWGGLLGAYLVIGRVTAGVRARLGGVLRLAPGSVAVRVASAVATFHLIALAWVFFRASTIGDAVAVVAGMVVRMGDGSCAYAPTELVAAIVGIAAILAAHLLQARGSVIGQVQQWPVVVRWSIYAALILAVINLQPEYKPPFMYMQY